MTPIRIVFVFLTLVVAIVWVTETTKQKPAARNAHLNYNTLTRGKSKKDCYKWCEKNGGDGDFSSGGKWDFGGSHSGGGHKGGHKGKGGSSGSSSSSESDSSSSDDDRKAHESSRKLHQVVRAKIQPEVVHKPLVRSNNNGSNVEARKKITNFRVHEVAHQERKAQAHQERKAQHH